VRNLSDDKRAAPQQLQQQSDTKTAIAFDIGSGFYPARRFSGDRHKR
jgi:hypothetical protein